ncbi:MAG: putative polyphosphate-selective porin [Rhodospirillales bacterium]|nr:putative polyphosphate-selective porin [Rhodospirillales bacterium]
MLLKHKLACGALVGATLAMADPSSAQTTQTTQALQQQIKALQEQLQSLQSQVNFQAQVQAETSAKAQQQAKAAAAVPANAPRATLSAKNRPGFVSADGQNSIELTSRLQLDFADYLHVQSQARGNPAGSLTSGINARRARIGVLGKFMGDWNYELTAEFGGTSDTSNTANTGAATTQINHAYLAYTGFRPVVIEGGYMDVPWTLDEATSSNDIMFLERASAGVVATNLAAGDARSALGVRSNGTWWWAGGYATGPSAGVSHTGSNGQQLGGVARATINPIQTDALSLHFGVDGMYVAQPRSGTPPVDSLTLTDRPDLRVDPTSFLSTGAITTKHAEVIGVEAAAAWGSFFAQGEYYHYMVDRFSSTSAIANRTLNFDGGYIEASYVLTGEGHKYNPETGAYGTITPAHPVSLHDGGIGAWEVAARFDQIDLNSNVTPGISSATTGGVFGGLQRTYTAGLNWYVNGNIRFMLNYIHADINKLNAAGGLDTVTNGFGTNGAHIDALAVRTQIAF